MLPGEPQPLEATCALHTHLRASFSAATPGAVGLGALRAGHCSAGTQTLVQASYRQESTPWQGSSQALGWLGGKVGVLGIPAQVAGEQPLYFYSICSCRKVWGEITGLRTRCRKFWGCQSKMFWGLGQLALEGMACQDLCPLGAPWLGHKPLPPSPFSSAAPDLTAGKPLRKIVEK